MKCGLQQQPLAQVKHRLFADSALAEEIGSPCPPSIHTEAVCAAEVRTRSRPGSCLWLSSDNEVTLKKCRHPKASQQNVPNSVATSRSISSICRVRRAFQAAHAEAAPRPISHVQRGCRARRCPRMPAAATDAPVVRFTNCCILRSRRLQREDLWVREGKILDPEKLFFDERRLADVQVDCKGSIIAPGFIDVQINGGFGVDFSLASDDVGAGISLVGQKILSHGVTSFCPTLVTSPPSVYHKVLPHISIKNGGLHGAGVLGVHLEGPFISKEKRGAHPEHCLRTFETGAFQELLTTYGSLDRVSIVTLAPEMKRSSEVIRELTKRGICVSLGHSVANLSQAEEAVQSGATFITHLFNAMLPFHHRDPGIVGLLTSDRIPPGQKVFYGMISDGIHTNPAALRIAHRAHPKGLVLVTDAIPAMGLPPGRHTLGQQVIEMDGLNSYVAGTKTLSGSVATMDVCVRHFKEATGCTTEAALEAASLHPAQLLNIEDRKGTLDYDSDADFVLLDDHLHVRATYIAGQQVWRQEDFAISEAAP